MTKAKARQRAKAKAGQKAKKREIDAAQPGQKAQRGHFDPGSNSITKPMVSTNAKNFAEARRGSTRSR